MTTMTTAIERVADERARQIEKGFTPEHDDEHGAGHLLALASTRLQLDAPNLIEAAALIVAAIEHVDRQELRDAEIVDQLDDAGVIHAGDMEGTRLCGATDGLKTVFRSPGSVTCLKCCELLDAEDGPDARE